MKKNNNIKIAEYDWFKIYTITNDCMGRDILNGVCWESHIVSFLNQNLGEDSIFIDVGSNYGWHSIIASNICKEVHSFEPQNLMYKIQKMSLLENNIENVIIYDIALGEKNKKSQMSRIDYQKEGVNIGDLSIGNGGEDIEVITLDSMNMEKIDIIKIDVQGYEKFVLEGAIESIKKHKPIMIVEFEEFQLKKFGYGSTELFDFIRSMDYEIYYLEYHYPSDHVCVHHSMVEEFETNNNITKLTENNHLNRNLENGVNKKITKTKKKLIYKSIK
jgi:FkbM family methyltransferase